MDTESVDYRIRPWSGQRRRQWLPGDVLLILHAPAIVGAGFQTCAVYYGGFAGSRMLAPVRGVVPLDHGARTGNSSTVLCTPLEACPVHSFRRSARVRAAALAVVPLLLATLTTLARPAPLSLAPLQLLPGDRQPAPAAGIQETPRIAAGGGGYLVVWSDQRSALTTLVAFSGGPYMSAGIGSMRDIYAARLDATGALVDSIPILVAQQTLNQGFPAVAWNGQNWLVAWSGQTDMACCPNARIFAARVSASGAVLDPTPIAVATDTQVDGWYGPAVGSDGTRWAVVYRAWDAAGVSMLLGKRIAADGTVLDTGAKELRHDTWNSYPIFPDLVFAADEYMLVWTEDFPSGTEGAIRAQRLTAALDRTGGVIALNPYSPTKGHSPRVATDGTSFFAAWFEDRYFGWAQVFATRVTHAGVVSDPSGIAVTPYTGYAQFTPQVAWDGSAWFVGYQGTDLRTTRVSAAGAVLDANGIVVRSGSSDDAQPTMAARVGGGVQVAWKDIRAPGGNPEDIYTRPVTAAGVSGAETCVSLAAPRQTHARLVAGGGGHLAVFRSEISGSVRIVAQRLDAAGTPIDQTPIVVAAGPNLGNPSVAWNGSLFLIAWEDVSQTVVSARRLRPDGTFADATPRTVLTARTPVVAALGDVFLVAGVYDPNPHFSEPRYVRVRGSDGMNLDATPSVLGSNFAVNPTLTRLGSRWLLMWEGHPTHDDPSAAVSGAFIASDGSASGGFNVSNVGSQYAPSVTNGPDTALVAWHDTRNASNLDIYAERILSDGTRLDGNGIHVLAAANDQRFPEVGWNGREFVVGFEDDRNEGTPGVQQFRGDVYGARVGADGSLLDPDGFAVSRDSIMETGALAGGSGGTLLVGCSVFEAAAPFANYRIGLRAGSPTGSVSVDDPRSSIEERARALPNPFGGETRVRFTLARAGHARVTVHDLAGREIRVLRDAVLPAGIVILVWDGRDNDGVSVSPGVYLVGIHTADGMRTTSVARLR